MGVLVSLLDLCLQISTQRCKSATQGWCWVPRAQRQLGFFFWPPPLSPKVGAKDGCPINPVLVVLLVQILKLKAIVQLEQKCECILHEALRRLPI